MANLSATGLKLLALLQFAPKTFETNDGAGAPCHREATPANRSSRQWLPALLSARCDRQVKNRVSFWSSTPNNLVFLPVDSAMASAHNGIFRVASTSIQTCSGLLSQERMIWPFL